MSPQLQRFVDSYIAARDPVHAAIAAGVSQRAALTFGLSMIHDPAVVRAIAAKLDPEAAAKFRKAQAGPLPPLERRIRAYRDLQAAAKALAARGTLPQPSLLVIHRKP